LKLQHGFENSPLMVLFHYSFLKADVAIIANLDAIRVKLSEFLNSTVSFNEGCAKF
jgi:hypothetical protein